MSRDSNLRLSIASHARRLRTGQAIARQRATRVNGVINGRRAFSAVIRDDNLRHGQWHGKSTFSGLRGRLNAGALLTTFTRQNSNFIQALELAKG
jgi:hypothetical protein